MAYDFDTPIQRKGSDCIKFDGAAEQGLSPDLLPLWVADMDFRTAPEILAALHSRVDHGIFGYTATLRGYAQAVDAWMHDNYGWLVAPEQIVMTSGVVNALAMAVRAFTRPGDGVIIQQPVYHPFASVVTGNGRVLMNTPLLLDEATSHYHMDFDALEQAAAQPNTKLMLLCNPHNPVGRAWTRPELQRVLDICLANDVIVVSDEIHMDFIRPGHEHVSLGTFGPEVLQRCAICTSASKTFNLAALQCANTVIPNESLRRAFKREISACGCHGPNLLGMAATQAAYEHGAPWLRELKEYLEGNWTLLDDTLRELHERSGVALTLVPAQSTYLAWVDCRGLGMDASELERFIQDEAGLWLDCGHEFGPEGTGFVRINLATQRAFLQRALDQLCDAVYRRLK